MRVRVHVRSLPALVVAASLQRDLDDLVPHTHVELAAAVQDQQAPDGLALPGREQLDLLQQAAPAGMIEGRKHLPDGAVVWKGRSRWMEERESVGGWRGFYSYEKRRRRRDRGRKEPRDKEKIIKATSICIRTASSVSAAHLTRCGNNAVRRRGGGCHNAATTQHRGAGHPPSL